MEKKAFHNTEIAFQGNSDKDLRRMRLLFVLINNPFLTLLPVGFIRIVVRYVPMIRALVRETLFRHFCGGENIEEFEPVIQRLGKANIRCIFDYAIEHESSESAYLNNQNEILSVIQDIRNRNEPFKVVIKASSLGSTKLMARIQQGLPLTELERKENSHFYNRIALICKKAYDDGISVFFDAEESSFQDVIDDIALQMMEKYNKEKVIIYNTFQSYRWDRYSKLNAMHTACQKSGALLGVKLVRGAYMEQENAAAKRMAQKSPIHTNKHHCDMDFNAALKYCVEHYKEIALCAATHNEYSIHYLQELIQQYNVPRAHSHVSFAQLYGMGDVISYNLSAQGYNVGKYLPYGKVEKVIPYLYRRIQENKSIRGQGCRELQMIRLELKRRKEQISNKDPNSTLYSR